MKLAFIGLGVMGFPMAGHLAAAGHQVRVFNRTPAKAEAWAAQHSGAAATTPADAASGAEMVLMCVGRDDDVRALVPQVLESLAPNGLIIDHTTTSAVLARDMARLAAARGANFLDAPVSGGQAGANAGRLSVMIGGDPAAYERAAPVLAAYGRSILHMGESGAGQLTKMVNQIAIAGVLQGLAEALNFTRHAALDPDTVLAAIRGGAAQSWQMENRWPTMARDEFDFGFAVDWMRKDLGIALAEAQRNGAQLELAQRVNDYYAEIHAMGGGRWDTSALVKRLN